MTKCSAGGGKHRPAAGKPGFFRGHEAGHRPCHARRKRHQGAVSGRSAPKLPAPTLPRGNHSLQTCVPTSTTALPKLPPPGRIGVGFDLRGRGAGRSAQRAPQKSSACRDNRRRDARPPEATTVRPGAITALRQRKEALVNAVTKRVKYRRVQREGWSKAPRCTPSPTATMV